MYQADEADTKSSQQRLPPFYDVGGRRGKCPYSTYAAQEEVIPLSS